MPFLFTFSTDYGRPVRKSPSLHGRKSTPNPKFLGTAKAYFVCHIGPNFQISLIYAFIGCPQSLVLAILFFSAKKVVCSERVLKKVQIKGPTSIMKQQQTPLLLHQHLKCILDLSFKLLYQLFWRRRFHPSSPTSLSTVYDHYGGFQ